MSEPDSATTAENPTQPPTLVFGPAYLDRVVRVNVPLLDPDLGAPPLDRSVDGEWFSELSEGLTLKDPDRSRIEIELPPDWLGPSGVVKLARPFTPGVAPWFRSVSATGWQDDLGGMGSGYAAALGGELVSALGDADDSTSLVISELLTRFHIKHHPVRVPGRTADWTLLVSSGEHGDKLPIGFRGCHAGIESLAAEASRPCGLRVVASFPNRLAAEALSAPNAALRFFAPALRNMLDQSPPILDFAASIDVLSCNMGEWESLADREQLAWRIPVLILTDGPRGATIRFTLPNGDPGRVTIPAFPRAHPPKDTNRAGESFAAAFLRTIIAGNGLQCPSTLEQELVEKAALRASAAAALVLDRTDFGFPTDDEIDEAIRLGIVA